jgi:predicted nucleic acid-binding protein
MSRLIVDANLVVALATAEPIAAQAAALIDGHELHCPTLVRLECAIAIARKRRRGELTERGARESFAHAEAFPAALRQVDDELVRGAFALAMSLGHEVSDCVYLALAIELGASLATADRRFAAAVRAKRGLGVAVMSPEPV